MISKNQLLFKPIKKPDKFLALGYMQGAFYPDVEEDSETVTGTLITTDGVEISAFTQTDYWQRITRREDYHPDKRYYWQVYFRTQKNRRLTDLNLLRHRVKIPPFVDTSGETLEKPQDLLRVRGRLHRTMKTAFTLRIERNQDAPPGQKSKPEWKPFLIRIEGNLPDEVPDQFWEVVCTRQEDLLTLKRATLVTGDNWFNSQKQLLKSLQVPSNAQWGKSSKGSRFIMIEGKQAEMTIKFTDCPENIPTQGKKVTFQVMGENGVIVRAEVNRKTLARQVQKLDTFEHWIGALSGRVVEISKNGMVFLENASVQIFEKKQKNRG